MPLFSLLLDLGVRLPGLLGQSSSSKPQILTAVTLVESSKRWKCQAQRQCMLWHMVKLITRPRLKPLNSKYRRQRKPLSELRATTLQKFSAHHKSPFQYMLQLGRRWKYKVEMSSETTEPVPLHAVITPMKSLLWMHDTIWHVHVTMMRVDRHYISNVQSFDATLSLVEVICQNAFHFHTSASQVI